MDVELRNTPDGIFMECPDWSELRLGPLQHSAVVNGRRYVLRSRRKALSDGERTMRLTAPGCPVEMNQIWQQVPGGWRVATVLFQRAPTPTTLNSVELLALPPHTPQRFPETARQLRMFEQGPTEGRVPVMFPESGSEESSSSLVWMMVNSRTGNTVLTGFLTQSRWTGHIHSRRRHDLRLDRWSLGFDGGDVLLQAGGEIQLEEFVVLCGNDPHAVLDRYGATVNEVHKPHVLSEPPVSWCSWYPHRLGVTAEKVLANARLAKERLKKLGMKTFVIDLGWQRDRLPSQFVEHDGFPHGLRGVADELEDMGFDLGIWSAPTNVSEHDALITEHPEYLAHGPDGKPIVEGRWFWQPHGGIATLDMTHPGAQQWLRDKAAWLARSGARYLKADFIANLSGGTARNRHNPRIVAGGGAEAGRIAARILRDALRAESSDALFLNCGGPEVPGPTQADLLYACPDTGNTGHVGWHHLETVFRITAAHLFKNRRWGIIQPSCLCVGLPGTLAEAQVRATAAFMADGQVDVGDDLPALPEDRWHVLTSTLPVCQSPVRAVDLFQPIRRTTGGYSTQDGDVPQDAGEDAPPATLWSAEIDAGWDRWTLAAVFDYSEPKLEGERAEAQLRTYILPLERLGLPVDEDIWAHEFWSGQFAGCLPFDPPPEPAYRHPGDAQQMIRRTDAKHVSVSFFGPGVKLIAFRRRRPHPWVVGTSFHQSCGWDLRDVAWDGRAGVLSGTVYRPAGEYGSITLGGIGRQEASAEVDERPVPVRTGARGSVLVPVVMGSDVARWRVTVSRLRSAPQSPSAPAS